MTVLIRGIAYQRPAAVELDGDHLRWRATKGQFHPSPQELDIPLDKLAVFAVDDKKWTATSTFGAVCVALAVLWLANGSVDWPVGAVVAAVGALGIGLRRLFPVTFLTIRTLDRAFVLRVARRSAGSCRTLAHSLQADRPELVGVERTGLLATVWGSLRDLWGGRERLRLLYRSTGSDESSEEERFIRARRRSAGWIVLWLLALPVSGAVLVQPLLPEVDVPGLVVRTILWLGLLCLVSGLLQGVLVWRVRQVRDWLRGHSS